MGGFSDDVRHALRIALRSPGGTAVVVLTLGTGIAAATIIFSVFNGLLLRPLPYRNPAELVLVTEGFPKAGTPSLPFSPPDYGVFAGRTRSLVALAAYRNETFELSGGEQPRSLIGARVSASLFGVLGVRPILGRGFTRAEDVDRLPVVVLSDRLWRTSFAGDPRIVGREILLDRQPHTVVGVMPRQVEFPPRGLADNNQPADLFVPMGFTAAERQAYGYMFVNSVIGRLAPGVSLAQARGEAGALVAPIMEAYPPALRAGGAAALELVVQPLSEQVVGGVRALVLLMMSAAALLLLLASVNVATVLIGRVTARRQELSLRAMLGAQRSRLARMLFTESLLYSLVGGGIAVVLSLWGIDLLVSLFPTTIPRAESVVVDLRVLVFTAFATILTAAISTIGPTLSVREFTTAGADTSGRATASRRGRLALAALVSVQCALALVLAVGAGLLVRSFVRLAATDPGFVSSGVLSAATSLPPQAYPTGRQVKTFYRDLMDRLQARGDILAAGAATSLPMQATEGRSCVAERPEPPGSSVTESVSAVFVVGQYFEALGIPLRRGRYFAPDDTARTAPPAVIINEALAQTLFGRRSAVGERIRWQGAAENDWMTIVGVVGNIIHGPLGSPIPPVVYEPFLQVADSQIERAAIPFWRSLSTVVRGRTSPAGLVPILRREVRSLDSSLPLVAVETMDDKVLGTVTPQRFNMALLAGFSGTALFMAAIGLAGVIGKSVSQRRREMAVRLALGASPTRIVWQVVREGLIAALAGLAVGLPAAWAFARLLAGFLYQLKPSDALTFTVVAGVLLVSALASSYIPARRILAIDPAKVLKEA